jgi:dolichyl-phosphate-mannose-protein mannosyltransferase
VIATHQQNATESRRAFGDHPVFARLASTARWLVPTLLVIFAGVLLLNRLSAPPRIIFDETYYVNDARSFLATGGVEDSFAVHPPVGKWLIAVSIKLAGDTARGWRLAGALAGMGMVLLTYLLSLRLLRWRWQAAVAAFLLTVDGLFLVQARTSMLDIFLAMFVLLGAWLLVRDLQDLDRRSGETTLAKLRTRGLGNRWLAGVAFGLAIATKWSGLLALAATIILVVAFEILAHRRTAARGIGARRLAWVVVGPLLLAPLATYVVSYGPWLGAYEFTTEGNEDCPDAAEDPSISCDVGVGGRLQGLWREHGDIYRFHRDLESTHSYRSEPYTWPVLGRPIAYYYETCKQAPAPDADPCEVPLGTAAEVLAIGNPALWWSFLLFAPLLTGAMGRRDPSAWVLGGFYGALFLPWLVVARPAFLFYMVPAIAFMAITVALALGRLREQPWDYVPWLAGAGAGLTAAVSARIAGAEAVPSAIAFAIGWVFAPLVVTLAMERIRIVGVRRASPAQPETDATEETAHEPDAASPMVLADSRSLLDPRFAGEPSVRGWWTKDSLRPSAPWIPAAVLTVVLLAAATQLFLYFLPIWTGVPMDAEVLRGRWWFSSWI